MSKIDIVITMAGLGSRFKKAGYTVPKYMIEVRGKTLFEWSMKSLVGFNAEASQYIFIVRKEDDSLSFIKSECKKLSINKFYIIELDHLTDGQATTVMCAKNKWNKKNELLIYNIDTYVEENRMLYSLIKGDGFIPCFNGDGDHWSFVKIDQNGLATQVREKMRISRNCTIGAYYFKSCKLYEDLYNEYYKDNLNMEKGEKYVAPLYNYLISKGGKVYISNISSKYVHVLGTPEEIIDFTNK